MKKALMVLGLAMCTTFAFAQTNSVSILKSKQDATVAAKAPNAALVDYKASIFTKDGDTLITWQFDQNNQATPGTLSATDMINDTAVGSDAHQQNSAAALWARIQDSAWTHSTAFESTYPDLAASTGLMNGIRLRMGAYNNGSDNGFMFVDLYEAARNSGNFNTYMALPAVQTPTNTGVVDIAFHQAAAKYYEQYFIDYKVGNSWKTREINVEGIDCDVNSWITYRATYVMPLELAAQPTIELRFRIYSYGRGAIYGRFWAVDNVSVIAYPNPTNRWQNYGEKYIDGAYGTLPEGMTIPMTWASTIYNTGTGTMNNVNMQMSHLYFDNEELQTNVFLTASQDPIPVGATKVVKINERGFYNDDADIDYQGWLGYAETYASEHIGSPWTLRGMPTTHPGYNYVTATATCGDLTAEWDTILYRVSQMEEVEPGMIEGYRWAHDNGLIPSDAIYCAQFDDEGYITDSPESSDHYTKAGYNMTVRYTTGNDIPEGWVIRGLEYVVATTADVMDNAEGAQFVPLAYTEEYEGESVGWNAVNTGVSSAIVEVSENDVNPLETGYILPGQSYRAINVLFPEQPALEPNTAYRFGYRLNRDGFFAPASIAWSYKNEQGTYTAYYNDANVAPFYNQFLHGTYYDVYINDPNQPDPNRANYLWASGYFEGTPMIRPIVGPAMDIPRTFVYPQCEGDTNYYIEYEDDDVCGADVSIAEGSSPVFYVVPLGDHMVIDQIFVDGVAIEPWNEEEGTGDPDCWTGEYNVTNEEGQVVLLRNYIAYQYSNITAPAAGQAHTISATCHWEPWGDPIGIDPVAANVSLGLSPNPATSQVSMNIKGVTGMVSCNIIDMSGRVVYNANINAEQTHTINLSNIPAGAYFVRVTNNDFSKVEKLIVR